MEQVFFTLLKHRKIFFNRNRINSAFCNQPLDKTDFRINQFTGLTYLTCTIGSISMNIKVTRQEQFSGNQRSRHMVGFGYQRDIFHVQYI